MKMVTEIAAVGVWLQQTVPDTLMKQVASAPSLF